MSDKEKLDDIKSSFDWGLDNLQNGIDHLIDTDVEFLIQQAEKVEQLNEQISKDDDLILKLNSQVNELIQAIYEHAHEGSFLMELAEKINNY
jgi:hypothetical protein